MKQEEEIWKQLDKPFDQYEISSFGNYRKINTEENLKQFVNAQHYHFACVLNSDTGITQRKRIHNLMGQTFYPEYKKELKNHTMLVHHKDGNTENNHLENLQPIDRKEHFLFECTEGRSRDKMLKNFARHVHRPVLQYTIDGELVREYPTTRSAEKDGFISESICRCASGMYKQHKGFVWKYKDEFAN